MVDESIETKKDVQGIGGWLLIPTIEFIVLWWWCSYFSFLFIQSIFLYSGVYSYSILMILYLPFTILFIYALILEFQKKKKFKYWAIGALWSLSIFILILNIIIFGNTNLSLENFKWAIIEPGLMITNAIIWTIYLNKSKRVENTFVN